MRALGPEKLKLSGCSEFILDPKACQNYTKC